MSGSPSTAGAIRTRSSDCCTREIAGWSLDGRCRAQEATEVVDAAVAARQVRPGELTLGIDNSTALTARGFGARLAEHGIINRRGGYRDPESQAFIESGFSKLKQRCAWREEFETSTKRASRSARTSTATTTDPTAGWPTERRAKSLEFPRFGGHGVIRRRQLPLS